MAKPVLTKAQRQKLVKSKEYRRWKKARNTAKAQKEQEAEAAAERYKRQRKTASPGTGGKRGGKVGTPKKLHPKAGLGFGPRPLLDPERKVGGGLPTLGKRR